MNLYQKMREKQQREINEFPLGAAFSNEQFEEMMKKFGLPPNDVKGVCSLGCGMYCKREDLPRFKQMLARHTNELKSAATNKETGFAFAYDMFLAEFFNHECGYTGDFADGINATCFTENEISGNKMLVDAFNKAKYDCLAAQF